MDVLLCIAAEEEEQTLNTTTPLLVDYFLYCWQQIPQIAEEKRSFNKFLNSCYSLPRSSRLVLVFTAVLGLFDSSSDRVPDTAQVSQDEKEDYLVCPTPLF